ncbi:MAG: hypothetical protein NTW25_08140 [Candidatus Kapabacteria bacterium]|nr:hypothetical protein [Candidatus Kapabacteria bacterium]
MKNTINNKSKVMLVALVAFVFAGMLSCSDANNPLGSATKNDNSGLVSPTGVVGNSDVNFGSDDNYGFDGPTNGGGSGNPSSTMTGKGTGKKGLPLPCLNLDSVQMRAFANIRKETENKNAQLRKEYEAKVKALRDAAMNAGSTVNRDSLNGVLKDLSAQLKALDAKLSENQKSTKAALDAISKSYQGQMKTAGTDRVARQALETKMKAEMKAAQDAGNAANKSILDQEKAIKDQMAATQKAMQTGRGTKLDPAAKAALDAQIKKLSDDLKAAIDANEKAALDTFLNMLTPDQKAIYAAWLAGAPCDTTTKKTVK